VHRKIDPSLQQGVVYLFGEEGPAADAGERDLRGEIPGGLDLNPLAPVAARSQQRSHQLRLPHRQRAAPGADPEQSSG